MGPTSTEEDGGEEGKEWRGEKRGHPNQTRPPTRLFLPDPLGELKRSPDALTTIRGLLLRRGGGRGGGEGVEGPPLSDFLAMPLQNMDEAHAN